MADATLSRTRELLSYSPDTGVFTWRCNRQGHAKAMTEAGSLSHGYVMIKIDQRRYASHRLAWLWMTGKWPSQDLDHINGVRNDNRFVNLREATPIQNGQNQRKANSHNYTSGLLGVSWCSQKLRWKASICVHKRQMHIGFYNDPHTAHGAYLNAKRKHHEYCEI